MDWVVEFVDVSDVVKFTVELFISSVFVFLFQQLNHTVYNTVTVIFFFKENCKWTS